MVSNPLLKYMPAITRILNSQGDLTLVDAPPGFPREWAYPQQVLAVKDIRENDDVLLASPTGSGKTAVYLSSSYPNKSMLIISPRKYLQCQISGYRNDHVVFGRSEYPCEFESNAADAPCRGKKETYIVNEIPQRFFTVFNETNGKEERHPYPCPGCQYLEAISEGIYQIKNQGTVIANFANYYPYVNDADVIVIDEADLFFSSVSSGKKMKYADYPSASVIETLDKECISAKKEYENLVRSKPSNRNEGRVTSRKIDKEKNHYLGIKSMMDIHDLCFQYTRYDRKTGKSLVYVEIRPDKLAALKERMFPLVRKDGTKRKVIIVTATPGAFTAQKIINYSVFMRTAVFYSPIALMTASNTSKHPEAFEQCAKFIEETHEGFKKITPKEGQKTVVHCGSLANAQVMADFLGKGNCDVHTTGKLMEIVEKFRTSPAEYMLVTAAEYGLDCDYINHQYILKSPQYASYDERLQCLQKEMSPDDFEEWYSTDGLYRTIQQCGRCGRGAGGIGFSFILDKKFGSVYGRFMKKLPVSFNEALQRGGTI